MTERDRLVRDYLDRLERLSAGLDAERREELLTGIAEHIDDARRAGGAEDEAAVRNLLDRLGRPEEIVAAAGDDAAHPGPGVPSAGGRHDAQDEARRPRRGTGLELAAVLMLTAGSFLPVVGWLVGVVLLWSSDRWRVGEKLLGTLVVPLGPGGLLVLGALVPFGVSTQVCSAPPVLVDPADPLLDGGTDVVTCTTSGGAPAWLVPALLLTLLVASVVVAVRLHRTARRRADAEQAPPRAAALLP